MNEEQTVTFQYDFEVEGSDYSGKPFQSSGTCRPTIPLEELNEDFGDNELFTKAAEFTFEHVQTFEVEKGGLNGISEINLKVKNLAMESVDGCWVMNGREIAEPKS